LTCLAGALAAPPSLPLEAEACGSLRHALDKQVNINSRVPIVNVRFGIAILVRLELSVFDLIM
jgi:hypothetical protein